MKKPVTIVTCDVCQRTLTADQPRLTFVPVDDSGYLDFCSARCWTKYGKQKFAELEAK